MSGAQRSSGTKSKIAWAQVATAIVVTASALAILDYFGIKPWTSSTPQKTIDVRSYSQSGGITAGEIHVGQQPRRFTPDVASQLRGLLPTGKKAVVTAVMGDQEAFRFASEIKDYLTSQGYEVDGVNQAIFSGPITGQIVRPTDIGFEIVIGAHA